MKKEIIELQIIDDIEESGTQAIALVADPAIEKNWLYFKKENFIEPKKGQEKDEYISECIANLISKEGYEQEQAAAICYSKWDEAFEFDPSGLSPYTQQTKKEPFNYDKILEMAETLGFSEEELKGNGIALSSISEEFASEKSRERILYKYSGGLQDNSRDFCKKMVKMNKYYTFQEIQQMEMESVNPGFGIAGSDTYSIWDYKGGVNCKHFWKQFLITPFRSFEGRPADGLAGEKPIDMPNGARVTLSKLLFANDEKMELVGPVAIPDIEIPRKRGDEIYFVKFTKDVVQRMAQKFIKEGRVGESNLEHNGDIDAGTYVYESWIVENLEDKANSVYGLDVPIGTWMVKMKVIDKGTWNKVKAGELRGFSLEGDFISKEDYDKYMKDKKIYDSIRDLLK